MGSTPDLGKEQCIALTTFRKAGQAVTTPVWFVEILGTIYVETHGDAGKLKRLRHTARVTLARCTYSGKVTGALSAGHARILRTPASMEGESRGRLHRDRAHFRLNLVRRTAMRIVNNVRREEHVTVYKRTTT